MSDTITSDRERADTIGDDHDKQAGGHGIQRSTGTPGANPPSRRKRLLALLGLAVASRPVPRARTLRAVASACSHCLASP